MRLVLKNIGSLLVTDHEPAPRVTGKEMASVGSLSNAWLVIEQGKIACYGEGEVIPFPDDELLDCGGGMGKQILGLAPDGNGDARFL